MYQKKQLTELQWISITYRITKYVTKKEIGCLTLMNYGMDQKGGRKLGCISQLRRVQTMIKFWLSTKFKIPVFQLVHRRERKGNFELEFSLNFSFDIIFKSF